MAAVGAFFDFSTNISEHTERIQYKYLAFISHFPVRSSLRLCCIVQNCQRMAPWVIRRSAQIIQVSNERNESRFSYKQLAEPRVVPSPFCLFNGFISRSFAGNNRYIDFFYFGKIKSELAIKLHSSVPPSPQINTQASQCPILSKPTPAQNVLASSFIRGIRSGDVEVATTRSAQDKWGGVRQY